VRTRDLAGYETGLLRMGISWMAKIGILKWGMGDKKEISVQLRRGFERSQV